MVYETLLPTEKIITFGQEAPEVWRMLQKWHLTTWYKCIWALEEKICLADKVKHIKTVWQTVFFLL